MGKVYVAAFLLPTPVRKQLTDIGWEFESPARLPESLIALLEQAFDVQSTETYLDMNVFEGEGLKITVIRDPEGKIQNIFVQLRGRKSEELRAALVSAGIENVEVFVPTEDGLDS